MEIFSQGFEASLRFALSAYPYGDAPLALPFVAATPSLSSLGNAAAFFRATRRWPPSPSFRPLCLLSPCCLFRLTDLCLLSPPSLTLLPVPSDILSAFSRANWCGRASGGGRVRKLRAGASRGVSGRPEQVDRRGQQVRGRKRVPGAGRSQRAARAGAPGRQGRVARRGSTCGLGAGGQLSLSLFPHPSPGEISS
uniref:Uncharacterized protein n=1 Tax=Ananas comosus var. bracteatus TaxID=296719 RepID=A0A6V7NGA5_ANACO|nr:unnamed protein product [Ananas comosus var. bracteatus]